MAGTVCRQTVERHCGGTGQQITVEPLSHSRGARTSTVRLVGLLRSRDTELMMDALRALGVRCEIDEQVDTTVTVVPPSDGRFHGGTKVFCGLRER